MRLRVLTYNIHKCVGGLDRRYDPSRIYETISHYAPDIVLLQEVARGQKRYRGEKQVEVLGDMLGMRHRTYFVNVRKRRHSVEYGNGILSRFPLTDTRNIDITIPPKKARSVLHGKVRVRMGRHRTRTVHLFNMHLGLSGIERKIQLRKFLDSHPFAGLHPSTPVIVAGDLNDVWGNLGKQALAPAGFRSAGGTPIATFPAYAPLRALDGIYVKGSAHLQRVFRSRLAIARQASDHLPLIADIDITNQRKRRTRR